MSERKRICRNCEHYDGGGLDEHGEPLRAHGECHNGISGRLSTHIDDRCEKGFYPCTTRWPLKAGPGGVR
jgi:hypothetical protein